MENRKFRKKINQERTKKYLFSDPRKKLSLKERILLVANSRKLTRLPGFFLAKIEKEGQKIKIIFASIGVLLFVLSIYITLGSTYFQISPNKVIIERSDIGSDVNIAYKSIENFYGESIFFISLDEVKNAIQDLQKNVANIDISRLYPNGLKIVLSSYSPVFLTYFPNIDKYYTVTSNGILIYERSGKSKLPIIDIVDPTLTESEFFDYKSGISDEKMRKILGIQEKLKKLFPTVNIARFAYFRLEQELHVSFESGGMVIFSLDGNEENELAMLKYWNDQEKNILEQGGFVYVDIRIIGRFFVCRDTNLCRTNLIRIYGSHYRK